MSGKGENDRKGEVNWGGGGRGVFHQPCQFIGNTTPLTNSPKVEHKQFVDVHTVNKKGEAANPNLNMRAISTHHQSKQ